MTVRGFSLSSTDVPPSWEVEPIVRVVAHRPGGRIFGSGFLIDVENWGYLVVTARHVVVDASIGSIDVELTARDGGGSATVRACSYAFDDSMVPSLDVAVIALFRDANVQGLPWGTGPAGTFSATALGFPAGNGTAESAVECFATTHQPDPDGITFFTTDVGLVHGMSGGALVTDSALLTDDDEGFGVVGLCSQEHFVIDLLGDVLTECAAVARAHSNGGSQ